MRTYTIRDKRALCEWMTDQLYEAFEESVMDDPEFISGIMLEGWEGFTSWTDAQLLQELEDHDTLLEEAIELNLVVQEDV